MNENQSIEQPVEVAAEKPIEAGAAGAPEGAVIDPTVDEVASLYKDLGIKAAPPSGKPKGRPKAAEVRAKDVSKDDAGDSKTGEQGNSDGKSKPKDAPDSGTDGDTGDNSDAKGTKVGKDSAKVPDESEEADAGVRDAKSTAEDDSKRGSEEDAEPGTDGTGQAADESDDETEEGKRPGKSNPKVEQRFQKLTTEVKEREQRIAELERQLQETTQKQQQAQIAQEDPEYTLDDFRKVSDEDGNVHELDPERAELAWRRWKDGYEQRSEQRNAEANRQAALEQSQQEYSETIMRQSVEAYDTLTGLMDEYPELVSTSGQYDAEFAAKAMPVINEALIYQEGTEPGNADGNQSVILGLKLNPKMILDAMKGIQAQKRSLPLNGTNDNVELRSNVNVPHSRSSDPTVRAANELYKELGINKRV